MFHTPAHPSLILEVMSLRALMLFFKHQTVDTKSTLIFEHEGFLCSLVVYHTQGIVRDMSD